MTGDVDSPPADEPVRVFEVRIEGPDILLGPPKG